MSLRLYATGVFWESGRGAAKMYGVMLALSAPPDIDGPPIIGIRYVPEIGLRSVNRTGEAGQRSMTDDEARAIDAWLRRVAS